MAGERMIVGIDISKKKADLAMMKDNGELLLRHHCVANNREGYEEAREMILKKLSEYGLNGLDFAVEATSYYWLPLYVEIEREPEFEKFDRKQYLLNAKWVRWYKRIKSPNHKNDRVDPMYIGDYVRTQRPAIQWGYDERWMPLRTYTRMRFHLVKSLTREKNLFGLYLFLAYTTYSQRKPFSNPLTKLSQALLRDPEAMRAFVAEEIEELAEMLPGRMRGDPQQSAERLRQVLSERYQLPDDLAEAIQQGIEWMLETILFLEGQIAKVEAKIAEIVKIGYPEIGWLDSIPGIGSVFASGIAAEIGDLNRFMKIQVWDDRLNQYRPRRGHELADAIGKYAGLWWPDNASGDFQAEEKRLSRQGNAYLRYYILEAADRMRQNLPRFARYYQCKHAAACLHKHKRALVLTGRKALDLIVALLRHHEPYQAREAISPLPKS